MLFSYAGYGTTQITSMVLILRDYLKPRKQTIVSSRRKRKRQCVDSHDVTDEDHKRFTNNCDLMEKNSYALMEKRLDKRFVKLAKRLDGIEKNLSLLQK